MDGQAEAMLRTFGLTEYEVKAYVTLFRLGFATAEQISEAGSIPLPRVYDTLTELQKKGFVLISKTRPKKFKPIEPDRALKSFLDIQRSEYDSQLLKLKSNIPNLIDVLTALEKTVSSDEEWNIWHTEKRTNVVKTLQDQEMSAKKEILIFAGDMSWFNESENMFKKVIKRGIAIKLLMNRARSKNTGNIVKRARKIGIKVKDNYTGQLRGQIVDNKIAAIAITTSKGRTVPDELIDINKKYELIIFENPTIINGFRENFEFWWNKLR